MSRGRAAKEPKMLRSTSIRLVAGLVAVVALLGVLRFKPWSVPSRSITPRQELTVGFLPVTCHLTCPVTSWVTKHSERGSIFRSQKFMDFPTLKEAFVSRRVDAAFVIMPLGMKLAMDGVPTKIVYLGHRD